MGAFEENAFATRRGEIERNLIGLLLDNPEGWSRAVDRVDAGDFCDPICSDLWRIMGGLHGRGRYTLRAVEEQLGQIVKPENAPGIIETCLRNVSIFGVEDLAADIRNMANKARLTEVCQWAKTHAGDLDLSDQEMQVLLEEALVDALKVSTGERKAGAFHEGIDVWLEGLSDAKQLARGVTTGVRALDEMTGGYRPGELIVVGGRPSMGKSIVATAAAAACARTGKGAIIISLEMQREELRARVLCDIARERRQIKYRDVLSGQISNADAAELRLAADVLKTMPIQVDDRGGLSAAQISLSSRRMARQLDAQGVDVGLIVVDYLQLMSLDSQWRGDKNNGVGANSAAMKQLAKELNCPVMLLSQLNRSVELRDDKRPTMSDLRDSGSIEQDADVVIFPFRPEYYLARKVEEAKKDSDRIDLMADLSAAKGKLSLIVEKQRNGPRGIAPADIDVATASIRDSGMLFHTDSSLFEGAA